MTNKIDTKITFLWNNIRELYKTYAHLPTEHKYSIIHPKTIERQEEQNGFYGTI